MRPLRSSLLLLSLLSLATACSDPGLREIPKTDAPVANDQPLADVDELLAGAPANGEIPIEDGGTFAALPAKYDVKKFDSPVKSQGSRGVCSIFSTVALMEHLYIKEGTITTPDFSEQYLQWSVKNQVGMFKNTSGSNNSYNLQAISQYGIVTEAMDPYETQQWNESNDPECAKNADGTDDNLPTKCYTNGDPSPEALAAVKYKLPASRYVNTQSIKNHIHTKEAGALVGLTFFYQSWNHRKSELPVNAEYWRSGFVTYPNEADEAKSLAKRAGHAILLVGWDDDLEVPVRDGEGNPVLDAEGLVVREKGFFVFKNSWGTGNFGINNAIGDGYGYISYKYVHEYGSAVVAGLPTNIPVPPVETTTVEFGNTTPVAIPDDAPAGVTSVIDVTSAGTIRALDVTVDVTHTYKGDLKVELVRGAKTIVLVDQAGGGTDDLKTTFTTTDFNGTAMAGTWTLKVSDLAGVDTGTLNAWSLKLTTSP